MKASLGNNPFLKYGAFITLILTMTMQMHYLSVIGEPLFYLSFGIYGLIFVILALLQNSLKIFTTKAGKPFLILLMITILYLMMFDLSLKGVVYTITRFVLYSVILYSLYYYYDYYRYKFFAHLQYFYIIALFLCFLNPDVDDSRFTGIFYNSNSTGFFAAVGFAIILFVNKLKFRPLFLLLFFILVVMSGSRTAMGVWGLSILIYMGLNFKKILIVFTFLFIVIGVNTYIETTSGIKTGIGRFINPNPALADGEEANILSGREFEFLFGIRTIELSPIRGHGLDKYAYISKETTIEIDIDENFVYNPHNSYIGVFVQYGVIFASMILLLIIFFVIKIVRSDNVEPLIKFLILGTMMSAATESFLFSISGYEGFLFWLVFAIGLHQVYIKRIENGI